MFSIIINFYSILFTFYPRVLIRVSHVFFRTLQQIKISRSFQLNSKSQHAHKIQASNTSIETWMSLDQHTFPFVVRLPMFLNYSFHLKARSRDGLYESKVLSIVMLWGQFRRSVSQRNNNLTTWTLNPEASLDRILERMCLVPLHAILILISLSLYPYIPCS